MEKAINSNKNGRVPGPLDASLKLIAATGEDILAMFKLRQSSRWVGYTR